MYFFTGDYKNYLRDSGIQLKRKKRRGMGGLQQSVLPSLKSIFFYKFMDVTSTVIISMYIFFIPIVISAVRILIYSAKDGESHISHSNPFLRRNWAASLARCPSF